MQITVTNVGTLSDDEKARNKFILTEDGLLLFGKCLQHKDLALHAKLLPTIKIVGAGLVPDDMETCSLDDDEWGDWKSVGYGVRTPPELKFPIKEAFFSYSHKHSHK